MDRRKQYLIPILVLVGVLSLTIGFAAFSSNLVIKLGAEVNPDASSFKVVFSKSATSEEAGTLSPKTGNGLVATIDNTSNEKPTISNIKAKFVSPGETTAYEFYAYNKGEYKAYLTNIAFNNVTGKEITKICVAGNGTSQELVDAACEGIKIHIDVDGFLADTTMDTSGHSIEKGLSHKIVITMEYDQNAARADGPFTVTFGDIQLTYMSIEGTGTSTGGLTGSSGGSTSSVAFLDTYTLKNGDTMSVVATPDTVDNHSIGYTEVVVLSDGSEWYYLSSSGDTVTLLSKYNYFTTGENAGEMDPSGTASAIAVEEWAPDGETPDGIIESTIIKPQIANSLDINESNITVSSIDYEIIGYDDPICQTSSNVSNPPFYYYQAGVNTCGSGSSVGVRVALSIDKSYVKYVLHSTEKLSFVDEYALLLAESSSVELTYKKVKETDEYIMLLSNNSSTLGLTALNVNTKSFATTTQTVGATPTLLELGYTYSCDETYWCVIDFSQQIEGIDTSVVNDFYSSLTDGFVEGDEKLDVLLIKITKN